MLLPSTRQIYLLIVAGCAAILAVALYAEHVLGMEPCPLCMIQRLFFMATGLVALIALIHNPGRPGRWLYAGLGIGAATLGILTAGRQLWLQRQPEGQGLTCGPNIDYIFSTRDFVDAIGHVMGGHGDCTQVSTLLGVSIPLWSLLAFVGFIALYLWQCVRRHP
ncbi:disulfide bond formation protein B [Marinimicrobium alkaliphilum]|uniref:disulfide bond formation protein B n=1 Tax=Marinimicrobium alkaliphilum TaxID=2202654 RepID=UPI000DB97275|nr:disulfide bond formation protein B [Marinimicrobium alkaliphilum]